MGDGEEREIQKGGDIYIQEGGFIYIYITVTDLYCCTAETNTTL